MCSYISRPNPQVSVRFWPPTTPPEASPLISPSPRLLVAHTVTLTQQGGSRAGEPRKAPTRHSKLATEYGNVRRTQNFLRWRQRLLSAGNPVAETLRPDIIHARPRPQAGLKIWMCCCHSIALRSNGSCKQGPASVSRRARMQRYPIGGIRPRR